MSPAIQTRVNVTDVICATSLMYENCTERLVCDLLAP
jgi:hypothetical protein